LIQVLPRKLRGHAVHQCYEGRKWGCRLIMKIVGHDRFRFLNSGHSHHHVFRILHGRADYIWKIEESNCGDRLREPVEITN
jgi:hypothetical protein